MRKIYLIPGLALLICCLFACQKGNSTGSFVQPSLIVGKWSLQREKITMYVDGVVQTDTTYTNSANSFADVQFNHDGTFNSVSLYTQPVGNGNLGSGVSNIVSRDSTSGIYSFVNSVLTLNAPVAGFGNAGVYGTTTTTVPVFNLISKSSQINQLTTSNLNIHLEYIYTATTTTETKTYKSEGDYYYTR